MQVRLCGEIVTVRGTQAKRLCKSYQLHGQVQNTAKNKLKTIDSLSVVTSKEPINHHTKLKIKTKFPSDKYFKHSPSYARQLGSEQSHQRGY